MSAARIRLLLATAFIPAGPVLAADDGLATAKAMVVAAHPGQCESDLAERFDGLEDQAFDVSWPETRYDGTVEDVKGRLYQITCGIGAYNVAVAFIFAREDGFPEEGEIVSFAVPAYSVDYEPGDDTYTKLVRDPAVTGFTAGTILVNPEFDPETNMISTFEKWRGLGDAYSAGRWTLDKGSFVLKHYVIDPIYEANLEDPPEALIDTQYTLYDAGP